MTGTEEVAAALAATLDATDPLASLRDAFIPPEHLYLDGNSLGPPLRAALERVLAVMDRWSRHGVGSWPDWLAEVRGVADALAATVLEVPGPDVALADSTSVNLYKLVEAVVDDAEPGRRIVVVDPNEFPTNRYIVDGIAVRHGLEVRPLIAHIDDGVDLDRLEPTVGRDVAAVVLSQVNYRSGALVPMEAVSATAQRAGTTVIWDLSHSAGVCRTPLGSDLAVGATYKHLGGGPGAPSFIVVPRARHDRLRQPIWGWFGHRDQFGMHDRFDPDPSISRFLVGTPPMLSVAPLAASVDLLGRVGVDRVRDRSVALVDTARAAARELLAPHGFRVASPADPSRTGAHLTLEHESAWPICQAARERGLVVDFREPRRIRLGPAALHTRHQEVVEAARRLAEIVQTGAHESYPVQRHGVT